MVGKKIRELRKANGFTQKNVAVLLGVAQVSVSRWELGKVKIPDYWIERLADLFCVDKDLLFGIADGEYVEDVVSREWHDEQVLMLLRERDNLADYAKCLKKEVDDLTAFKEEAISMNLYEKGKQDGKDLWYRQAVKDTAREICNLILEYWEKKQFVECDWLRVAISERYGVEVE